MGVTIGMGVFASVLWIAGYWSSNGGVAVIGAGILGGLLYDLGVTKGQYVMPTQTEDGINLGSLYGAVVGFAIAIAIIQPNISTGTVTIYTSFDAFLIALGIKAGSEYASSDKLMTKAASSISYDAGEVTTRTQPKTVKGTLLDGQGEPLKNKVVHIFVKNAQGDMEVSRDTVTTDLAGNANFTFQLPLLDKGDWESWAAWDGDEKNKAGESAHEKFKMP